MHRFNQDPGLGLILPKFRNECPTVEEVSKIISIKQSDICKIPRMIQNTKYATFPNREKDLINAGSFLEELEYSNKNFTSTNNFILMFM